MEKYAQINTTNFPLVTISFTGNKSTDENFQHYLNETLSCYDKQEKLAMVFDATNASLPAIKHQKMQADWLKEHQNLMKMYCAGTAYVIPNFAIRAVLKVIFSFQKQPVPFEIFNDLDAAIAWSKARLSA